MKPETDAFQSSCGPPFISQGAYAPELYRQKYSAAFEYAPLAKGSSSRVGRSIPLERVRHSALIGGIRENPAYSSYARSAIYYLLPLHLQPCFSELGSRPGDLLISEAAARETIALPIRPSLSKAQRETVVGAVVDFLSD